MNKTVLVVIQCRFSSNRLPGKALYPLADVPMLPFLIRRLLHTLPAQYKVALATTDLPADSIIAAWGENEGVQVVRGPEDDVLTRYMQCLKVLPADVVVRVTADNPLTCPYSLIKAVEELLAAECDYLLHEGLPYGAGVDVFTSESLRILNEKAKVQEEREHINLYILQHPEEFNSMTLKAEGSVARADLRMTVDTLNDWQTVCGLFDETDTTPWTISLDEAIARMDNRTL